MESDGHYVEKPITAAYMGEVKPFWRPTMIGWSLADMTRWWVAAKWLDDTNWLPVEEREQLGGERIYSTYVMGRGGLYTEVLSDNSFAFHGYDLVYNFCYRMHPDLKLGLMPLNVGDYIRYDRFRCGYRDSPKMIHRSSIDYFNSRPDIMEHS